MTLQTYVKQFTDYTPPYIISLMVMIAATLGEIPAPVNQWAILAILVVSCLTTYFIETRIMCVTNQVRLIITVINAGLWVMFVAIDIFNQLIDGTFILLFKLGLLVYIQLLTYFYPLSNRAIYERRNLYLNGLMANGGDQLTEADKFHDATTINTTIVHDLDEKERLEQKQPRDENTNNTLNKITRNISKRAKISDLYWNYFKEKKVEQRMPLWNDIFNQINGIKPLIED